MITEDPLSNPDASAQRALSLRQSGRLPEAAALYRILLDRFPARAQWLTGLGVTMLQMGENEQGIKLLETSVAIDPDQPEAFYGLGVGFGYAGRMAEALDHLERAIALQPDSAELHCNRGVVLRSLGRPDDALASYERALELKPDSVEALTNRGDVLRELKRYGPALESCDRAIAVRPDCTEAFNNRATVLKELGRFDEALVDYDRAIAASPGNAQAYSNRGALLQELGRSAEALASCDRAIGLNPFLAEAYNNRGNALRGLDKPDDALASYERALALRPDYAEAFSNRGAVLQDLGRLDEALASCDRAIALNPDYAEGHANRGFVLQALRRLEEALESYDRAIASRAQCADFHSNRGTVLQNLGRLEDAVASFDNASSLDLANVEAHNNRGNALRELKRFDEALASYDRAMAASAHSDSEYATTCLNKALLKLLMGDYEEGWRLYEWRWRALAKPVRRFTQPFWRGEQTIAGKTLLIHAEQGLGDAIQFCRYAPLAAALGAKVVLEVPATLCTLMSTLPGDVTVIEQGRPLPPFDLHCPIMSLPLVFRTTVAGIPADVPYLRADVAKRRRWQDRLGSSNRPRVGVVWSGTREHVNDRNRSMALKVLEPVLRLPCEFHSLQKEIREEDLGDLARLPQVQSHQADLNDFSDTAALIEMLDLVITVDTSVAHLAGALGCPVWILLPFVPDFRWLLDRTDSPWYPTATLFRQAAAGDWADVVRRVAEKLSQRLANPASATRLP